MATYVLHVLQNMSKHDDLSLQYIQHAARQSPYNRLVSASVLEGCFFAKRRVEEPSCIERALISKDSQSILGCLLTQATLRTAALVAAWMASGFAHGGR